MKRRDTGRILLPLVCLGALVLSRKATAAADRPHRAGGTVGPALLAFQLGGDGHLQPKMVIGAALRLEYAYRLVRGFELGVDLSYWYLPPRDYSIDSYSAFIPAVAVRPYLPFGVSDAWELGLGVRPGLAFIHAAPSIGTWTGWGLTGGPDVRFWLGPSLGLQFGAEFTFGRGKNPEPGGSWYQNESGFFVAMGPWVLILGRF